MSTSEIRLSPATPPITAENITAIMENARTQFMNSTRVMITKSVENSYTNTTFALELLYSELEAGSKELAVYRELFFFVSAHFAGTQPMTTEKWQELVHKLDALRKEKIEKAEEAKRHVQ